MCTLSLSCAKRKQNDWVDYWELVYYWHLIGVTELIVLILISKDSTCFLICVTTFIHWQINNVGTYGWDADTLCRFCLDLINSIFWCRVSVYLCMRCHNSPSGHIIPNVLLQRASNVIHICNQPYGANSFDAWVLPEVYHFFVESEAKDLAHSNNYEGVLTQKEREESIQGN
jgi:hypothetical protein